MGQQKPKENVTDYNEMNHIMANFINDSNSVIEFEDPMEANYYIDIFFKLLKIYYNYSKLKMNADKTSLIVIAKPKHDDVKEEIRIVGTLEAIRPKQQIKILRWTVHECLKMD